MKHLIFIILTSVILINTFAQGSKTFLSVYDKYWEIEDGYYRVMLSGKIGLVNQEGAIIVPCENEQVWNLQENGNIKVLKNDKLGIYNINGNLIIPPVYDMIWEFNDGRARVMKNGKVGYVNESGNEFIPCQYDQIWDFEDGRAKVLRNGSMGYINEAGNEFITAQYQKIWDFEGGRAKVLKNGKIGFINESGQEIIPCEYQQIGDFDDGVAKAIKNGQILYIDEKGNPTDYTEPYIEETKVEEESNAEPKMIYNEDDTTNVKIFGSKMQIINVDGSTQISFLREHRDKIKRKEKNKHKNSFHGHYSGVDLGFNTYLTKSGELSLPNEYDYLSLNSGKSIEFSANVLQQDIALGKKGNIGFVTGLGLTYNNYRYDNPIVPVKDDMGYLSYSTITEDVNKTKLTTLYLTAPLLLELQLGNKTQDRFYISAGAIGAYRLSSHTKVVTNVDGKKTKDKNNGSFNLNDFRYGAQVRLGYRALNFFGTYYLSPLFNKNKAPELYPISVGFSFHPDWW